MWLAICFTIILFQTVLITCRSDTLAMYIDLESAAHHASREKLAHIRNMPNDCFLGDFPDAHG